MGWMEETVAVAFGARLVLLGCSWLCASWFDPYDTSLDIFFQYDNEAADNDTFHCPSIVQALATWDGVYFANIACHGYQHEQNFAFFPGLAAIGSWARGMPSCRCWAAASIEAANAVAFFLATAMLFKLTREVMGNERDARVAAMLFAVNPALPFFGAAYTESIFALLVFSALYWLFRGNFYCDDVYGEDQGHTVVETPPKTPASSAVLLRLLPASILFALATCMRSNGVVTAGFVVHFALCTSSSIPRALARACFGVAIIVAPFIAFQAYAYTVFCIDRTGDDGHTTVAYDPPPPWCNSTIPSIYGYIQHHYWHVGFLQQYQAAQLPNFVLAAPVMVASVAAVWTHVRLKPEHLSTLALRGPVGDCITDAMVPLASLLRHARHQKSPAPQVTAAAATTDTSPPATAPASAVQAHARVHSQHHHHGARKRQTQQGHNRTTMMATTTTPAITRPPRTRAHCNATAGGFGDGRVFVVAVYHAFLSLFALLTMHVQVSTRLLASASPLLYWFGAHVFRTGAWWQGSVWLRVSLAYAVMGTALHALFLPWT